MQICELIVRALNLKHIRVGIHKGSHYRLLVTDIVLELLFLKKKKNERYNLYGWVLIYWVFIMRVLRNSIVWLCFAWVRHYLFYYYYFEVALPFTAISCGFHVVLR